MRRILYLVVGTISLGAQTALSVLTTA